MARQGAVNLENFIRNKIGRLRHWNLTSLGKKRPKGAAFEFTVMTYNILSQAALDYHMYLYMKCNPQYLSEEYRISKIIPEILKTRSDVVCLQEVEQYVYDQRIRHVFHVNGFGSIFKKRTGSKSDGCALLWRRAKFELMKHHPVDYKAKGCELLNRDNVGIIAVLKPRHPEASQTQLHIATTHLIYNPRRGDVKLCQLRLLLAELEKSAFKGENEHGRTYHPTILCGDFNFEPQSPLYKFVETGRIDVSGLVCGNMSGQTEGKNKGGRIIENKLCLDRIGIDDSGRYKKIEVIVSKNRKILSESFDEIADRSTEDTGICEENNSCDGSQMKNRVANMNLSQKDGEFSNHSSFEASNFSTEFNAEHLKPNASFPADESGRSAITNFLQESFPSSSTSSETEIPKLFYHNFNFAPTYKYFYPNKDNNPMTCLTGHGHNTVDHIFYIVKDKTATSYVEDKLQLLGSYSLPFADDIRALGGLPNAHLGSDHLSLMSKFLISCKR